MKASYARKIKQLTAELATFPEPDAAPEPSKATAKKAKTAKFDNELIVTMSSRAAGQVELGELTGYALDGSFRRRLTNLAKEGKIPAALTIKPKMAKPAKAEPVVAAKAIPAG